MDKKEEIRDYLKKEHVGRRKAVPGVELERLFDLSGRSLRRRISSLRQDGCPICSDGKGYYYAGSQHDINATVSRLNEFVTGISNAKTGLLLATVADPDTKVEIIVKVNGGVVENVCRHI